MTIIVAATGSPPATLSDVLLSRMRGDEPTSIHVPLGGRLQFSQQTAPIGMAQKTILLTKHHLLLWAGPQIVALAVAKQLRRDIAAGRGAELVRALEDLEVTPTQSENGALILLTLQRPGDITTVRTQAINAAVAESETGDVLYAGTGSFPVMEDLVQRSVHAGHPHLPIQRHIMPRFCSMMSSDLVSLDNYDFAYGGAYELAVCAPEGFVKIPYVVRYWRLEGGELKSGPVIRVWYQAHNMYLFKYWREEGKGSFREAFVVLDALRRNPPAAHFGGSFPATDPLVTVHVIYKPELGTAHSMWESENPRYRFDLHLTEAGLTTDEVIAPGLLLDIEKGGTLIRPPDSFRRSEHWDW